jgi:phosphoglycolate phosphatase-like HAD superfamily hydrolase
MKNVVTARLLTLLLTLGLALPAIAQEDALKDLPGYVDFGDLNSLFGEPQTEITIGGSILGLVGSLSASEDPEAAELFKRLKGVRVSVYETESLPDGAVDLVKNISRSLAERGWESVVTVNSEDEQVRIFIKMNDNMVDGFTVMALEEDEAAFINVIGNLNPAELEKVMDRINVNDVDIEVGDQSDD